MSRMGCEHSPDEYLSEKLLFGHSVNTLASIRYC